MASIFDIAPTTTKIDVRGTTLEARGVGLAHCRDLLARFPAVGILLLGSAEGLDAGTVGALLKAAPEAMMAVMASGVGYHGNEAAEQELGESLVLGEQLELIVAIAKLTAPKGKGPFVEALRGMGMDPGQPVQPGSANSGKRSPKPSPTSKDAGIPTRKS